LTVSDGGGPGRLRILHLAFDDLHRPESGGGAIRNHEINRRLAARHDVTAVTVSYRGARERRQDGVHYVPAGLPLGYYGAILTYFAAMPFVVWRHRSDLVVEDFAAPFGSWLVPLWTRRPVIGHVQWLFAGEKSRQYHLPFSAFERWGVRVHRRLITVSNDLAARLRSMNPRAHVVVLPNGLEEGVWQVARGSRRHIVYLGRIEIAGKGLDLLLQAFASIADRTDARLLIAGDGPDRRAVARMVDSMGLGRRVELLGRIVGQPRLELLASAQVACVTSRYETFGMVALEALACGTPVIAFDIAGLRELLSPETAAVVPPFRVDAYAETLAGLLADPERCRRMGERGRDVARGFDWDRIAERQEQVYLGAVGARARHPGRMAGG
jgi:glycosyltransferase involved in cell wall biosynthesis